MSTTETGVYVTPGHPVKEGAGYDCQCGQCLAVRAEQARWPAGPLACPQCNDPADLQTIETITGYCPANHVNREPDGGVDVGWHGSTEMDWDSSTTAGVRCDRCGWSYRGDDWDEKLAAYDPEPDDEPLSNVGEPDSYTIEEIQKAAALWPAGARFVLVKPDDSGTCLDPDCTDNECDGERHR